jgi:hypothetical protein
MKKFIISSILVALLSAGLTLKAQSQEEYLGLPGDNLNLYAVMQLFQESKTLEEFERNLNDPKTNINNLDLNGDNLVDYIKVFDNVDGNVHNIILQVAVTRRENQDVAVFTVQRFNNGQVMVQLTGDEALYGRNYIIEPIADETPNPGYQGTYQRTTTAQIAVWPIVRFIYLPTYVVWHSNWYWGYYPSYWSPWRPYSWHYYYGYHYHWNDYYYGHYHHTDHHYYTRYDDYYYHNHRSYSSEVNHNIKRGTYKTTYSHPEQRREGEALYATKYPERYKNSSSGNDSRRSESNAGNSSNSSRRSDNNVSNNRSSDKPKSFSNSGYSKRQNSNIDLNKSSDKSFSNSGNSRRSNGNNSSVKNQNGGSSQESRQNANVSRQGSGSSSSQNAHSSRSHSNTTSASPSGKTKSESSNNKETRKKSESKSSNEKASKESDRR